MLDVQLNLASSEKEPEQWRNVRLLFVRGNAAIEKQETGKHDWAVFWSTDINLDAAKILEIYALRWAVEVYFKEAKQHRGFLKITMQLISEIALLNTDGALLDIIEEFQKKNKEK